MTMPTPSTQKIPLDMVGSTVFGRYPWISNEQTWNFIISDDKLVPYAGHSKVANLINNGNGRGLYSSNRYDHMIAAIDNAIFTIDNNLSPKRVGTINSFNGDVFFAENNANQICVNDKLNNYIFDYSANTFTKAPTSFTPGHIEFQDSYFISPNIGKAAWQLSDSNNGMKWAASDQGEFQTKADDVVATVKIPGKGNLLFVFGSTVTESWTDIGRLKFPYEKNTSFNIDYGCINPATIATTDEFVVWLGINEKSGPTILVSAGGKPEQISEDGINFRLSQLKNPENSYGFMFKQDGHIIYQLTFPDDNVSYIYDFNTKKFFNVSDENTNFHIAKRVVYFNNTYYFVSFIDGNLYEMNTKYTTYNGAVVPRIRITKTYRGSDSQLKVINKVTVPIEQGEGFNEQRVDYSISTDGANSFGNIVNQILNPLGRRPGKLDFWVGCAANMITHQFRFWGQDRFLIGNGEMEIYQ